MSLINRIFKPVPPELFQEYHHKDREPNNRNDLIDYVIPFDVDEEKGIVYYTKYYKEFGVRNQSDQLSVREFNYWFRKGR